MEELMKHPVTVFAYNEFGQAVLQQGDYFYAVSIDDGWKPRQLEGSSEVRAMSAYAQMSRGPDRQFDDVKGAVDFVRSRITPPSKS
jgi:hypothetical protein